MHSILLGICWGPILVTFLLLRYNDMTKATHRGVYLALWLKGDKNLVTGMAAETGCWGLLSSLLWTPTVLCSPQPKLMLVSVIVFWLSSVYYKYLDCLFNVARFLMLTIITSVTKNGLFNNNNSHVKHECIDVVNILIKNTRKKS